MSCIFRKLAFLSFLCKKSLSIWEKVLQDIQEDQSFFKIFFPFLLGLTRFKRRCPTSSRRSATTRPPSPSSPSPAGLATTCSRLLPTCPGKFSQSQKAGARGLVNYKIIILFLYQFVWINIFLIWKFFELPYDPSCLLVAQSVGWLVGWSYLSEFK